MGERWTASHRRDPSVSHAWNMWIKIQSRLVWTKVRSICGTYLDKLNFSFSMDLLTIFYPDNKNKLNIQIPVPAKILACRWKHFIGQNRLDRKFPFFFVTSPLFLVNTKNLPCLLLSYITCTHHLFKILKCWLMSWIRCHDDPVLILW